MKNIYEYDINKNEIINDSKLLPTDKESQNYDWLWANNNKYENIEINSKKIGKWMLFPNDKEVNNIWNKIKKNIQNGKLWHSKVSTNNKNKSNSYAIMIYTKDYTDINDVVNVLKILKDEAIIKQSQIIRYKTDEQTRMGIYFGGRQKPWIYSSDTIKNMLLEKNWRVDKQKINSTDLHNQPSTSGYKPSSPKM